MPKKFKIDGEGYKSLEGFNVMDLCYSQDSRKAQGLNWQGREIYRIIISVNYQQRSLPILENVWGCTEYNMPSRKKKYGQNTSISLTWGSFDLRTTASHSQSCVLFCKCWCKCRIFMSCNGDSWRTNSLDYARLFSQDLQGHSGPGREHDYYNQMHQAVFLLGARSRREWRYALFYPQQPCIGAPQGIP